MRKKAKGATRSKMATLTRAGGRFRVRDGFQGVRTGRHSRRVPGAATLHPQGAILERDTFQTGTFRAGGCRIGTRHVPVGNIRVSDNGNDREVALSHFHTFSFEIKSPAARNDHHIDMRHGNRMFSASGCGLGTLTWKGTGMEVAGAASWKLRDEWSLVMVVEIDLKQVSGWAEL